MKKKIEGRVRRLGHDIHVDQIKEGLGMAVDLFSRDSTAKTGGHTVNPKSTAIIIAGRNFGRGRDEADTITEIKAFGIGGIVASSFGRDFFRDAVNHGLAVVESTEAFEAIADGESISIDIENSEIACLKGPIKIAGFPEIFTKIYHSGGLIPYARKLLGK